MRSSTIRPMTHVSATRSQRSTAGVSVNVKSLFGFCSSGSLKTLLSTPMLVIETVGFIQSGPTRRRTLAGSGSSTLCAAAGRGQRLTATTNAMITCARVTVGVRRRKRFVARSIFTKRARACFTVPPVPDDTPASSRRTWARTSSLGMAGGRRHASSRCWRSHEMPIAVSIDLERDGPIGVIEEPPVRAAAVLRVECHAREARAVVGLPLVHLAVTVSVFLSGYQNALLIPLDTRDPAVAFRRDFHALH